MEVPSNFTVSPVWFKDTQELCQRSQIACGQALAASAATVNMMVELLEELGTTFPDFRSTQHVMMTAMMVAQKEAAAVAANFELVRRDHVLHKLGLPREEACQDLSLGRKRLIR